MPTRDPLQGGKSGEFCQRRLSALIRSFLDDAFIVYKDDAIQQVDRKNFVNLGLLLSRTGVPDAAQGCQDRARAADLGTLLIFG